MPCSISESKVLNNLKEYASMVVHIQVKSFPILLLISLISMMSISIAMAGNVEKVKQQTMLIGTHQIDKMLENFSDNATWIEAPVPYGGTFHGRDEIRGFFLDKLLGLLADRPGSGVNGFFNSSFDKNKVSVYGRINATVKSTNKSFTSDWMETWTFGPDGKIVMVENYYNASNMAEIADAFKK
jgi:hypothetical protein